MKKVMTTKFVAFDEEEFDLEEDCKEYESDRSKEIYEYIENMDCDKTTKLPFHNGFTEIKWFKIYSMKDLQMLHDWAIIDFEEHEQFCNDILNEDFINQNVCIDHSDYVVYVNGTSEQYKELVNKLF